MLINAVAALQDERTTYPTCSLRLAVCKCRDFNSFLNLQI